MDDRMEQAPDRERIWRGKSLRQARRSRRTLDRGVPGQPLPAPDHHAEKDPIAGGPVTLGPDGFPFTAPLAARHTGLYNRRGLVSNLGQHKKAFYMLQKYYRELDSTQ